MNDKIAVTHVDTLLNKYKDENYDFNLLNEDFHVDFIKIKKGNIKLIVFAVFVEEHFKPSGNGLKKSIQMIDDFYQLVDKCNELEVALNYKDIKKINQKNKTAAILAIEGAKSIFDLSALRVFKRLGVRLITLTWNYRNHIADGVGELTSCGLTPTGKEFIKEMNRLNILVDISHLNIEGFWDVIDISDAPVIASHSNAKALCDHRRNLDDKQIKAVADSGGFIGINFCPSFLTNKTEADIYDVFNHIDYIKDLVGVEFIALGTDYDGIMATPNRLEDIGKLNKLTEIMVQKGYKEKEVEAILYKNVERVFKKI